MKRIALILVVIAVVAGGAAWYAKGRSSTSTAFRTAEVKRGDLVATISATGTVEPEEVVDVGAQVAGQILSFGKDASGKAIDYGSQIEEGMVLARIDDSVYNSDVASATVRIVRVAETVSSSRPGIGLLAVRPGQRVRSTPFACLRCGLPIRDTASGSEGLTAPCP